MSLQSKAAINKLRDQQLEAVTQALVRRFWSLTPSDPVFEELAQAAIAAYEGVEEAATEEYVATRYPWDKDSHAADCPALHDCNRDHPQCDVYHYPQPCTCRDS